MQQKANEQALALALVVILNWALAHLATNWAMPSEVAQAAQSVITILIGYYLTRPATVATPTPTMPSASAPSGSPASSGTAGATP